MNLVVRKSLERYLSVHYLNLEEIIIEKNFKRISENESRCSLFEIGTNH